MPGNQPTLQVRSTREWAEFHHLWEDSHGVAYVPAAPPLGKALDLSGGRAGSFGGSSPGWPAPSKRPVTKRAAAEAAAEDGAWVAGDGRVVGAEWFEVEAMTRRYAADTDPLPRGTADGFDDGAETTSGGGGGGDGPSKRLGGYGAAGSRMATEAGGWVPHGAMAAAKAFREKNLPGVPVATIHAFLREVRPCGICLLVQLLSGAGASDVAYIALFHVASA